MIIINSDDFGVSKEINKATFCAFEQGLISSTTTLVNFEDGFKDAVRYVKENKIDKNAIGIHLNLTEGIPLTQKMRDNPKFCCNGVFQNIRVSSSVFKLDNFSKQCIHKELDAQLNRFVKAFGFLPSHIDSHHHIHTEWAIAHSVMNLAKKYKIKSLRLARNIGRTRDFKKRIYRMLLNRYIRLKGFEITDKFGDVDDLIFSGIELNKDYELMVHVMRLPNNDEIVDSDHKSLTKKLKELFKSDSWDINNYVEFRHKSITK